MKKNKLNLATTGVFELRTGTGRGVDRTRIGRGQDEGWTERGGRTGRTGRGDRTRVVFELRTGGH